MYEIAARVLEWLADGRDVSVARVVSTLGIGAGPAGEALAWTAGEAVGELVSGAVRPDRLGDPAAGARARVTEVVVSAGDAGAVGLPCGGRVTLLVQPAGQLPEQVWRLLVEREPVCVVTEVGGDEVGRSTWFTPQTAAGAPDAGELARMVGRGATQTAATDVGGTAALVASYWPTPRLVVVGDGAVAAGLQAVAGLLGWQATTVAEAVARPDAVAGLTRSDAVVVLSHDLAVAGEVLRSALAGAVGYVGALGSRRTQQARARWLADHGVPAQAVRSIRGPAGLDVGARGPAEMAVSIVAEILAVQTGSTGQALRDRPGPVHLDQLPTPPVSGSIG